MIFTRGTPSWKTLAVALVVATLSAPCILAALALEALHDRDCLR